MDFKRTLVLLVGLVTVLSQPSQSRPHHLESRCRVRNIPIQDDFDIKKFTGRWFDVARTTLKHESEFIRSGVGQFSIVNDKSTSTPIVQYTYSGLGSLGCITPIIATGIQVTKGKMSLAFDSTANSFLKGSFWVVKTDYMNYALIYGCNQLRDDGHCHRRHQLVYIISRSPSLSADFLQEILDVVQDKLCVDVSQLYRLYHQETCLPNDNKMLRDSDLVVEESPEEEVGIEEHFTCTELSDCDQDALACEHGLKQDENGCDTCACHKCNPLACLMYCKYGFETDGRSCPVCKCAKPPAEVDQEQDNEIIPETEQETTPVDENAVVPEYLYDIQEMNEQKQTETDGEGAVVDEEDSSESSEDEGENEIQEDIVEIKEIPIVCAIPMCANRCEHGYKKSEAGCDTCTCNPEPPADHIECPDLHCHITCNDGFKKDEHGCEICRCNGCPDVKCLLYCPHGYKQNEEGCQYCECRQAEVNSTVDACVVANIEASAEIDVEKFVGEWRVLATAADSTNHINTLSTTIRIEEGDDGGFTTFIRSAWNGVCGPTLRGTWKPIGTTSGEFYINYGRNTGIIKIIHITESYDYMITYHCFHTRPDGTCAKPVIDILGRNGPFPEEVKEELLSKISRVCVGPDDFVQQSRQVVCHIRASNEEVASCKVSDFQPQQLVNYSSFKGRWYSVAKLYDRDEDQSGQYIFKRAEGESRISIKYRGSRNGICRGTSEISLVPAANNTGAVNIYLGRVRAQGKFMYVDSSMAIYYECGEETETGECKAGTEYVEFIHREKYTPAYINLVYGRILEDFCINPDQLTPVNHEVSCPVKDVCKISDIPTQEGFNTSAFAGTWHRVAKLKVSKGWDHVVAHVTAVPNNRLVVHYTGTKNGQCQPDSTAILSPPHPDHPGDLVLIAGRRTAHVKVVHTNYNVAIVYECQSEGPDNTCEEGHAYLDVLSRDPHTFTEKCITHCRAYLESACVEPDDLELTPHEVDCPLEETCVMANLPVVENFSIEQMSGQWYISMSDANSAQMVGPSSRDVTALPDGHIISKSFSIRNNICTGPRTFVGKAHNDDWASGQFSIIRGKFINRGFHVAYADNDTSVSYACMDEQKGVCLRGQMSIYVSSKTPTITEEKKQSLLPIIQQLCVNPDTMVSYDNTVECDFTAVPSTCQVEDTPIMKKFDIKQAMGKWYVVARTKKRHALDALTLELFPGKDDTVIAKYSGLRRGYCMEPKEFELTQQHEPEEAQLFIKYANNINGVLRVVYTDYSHMLLYECGLISSDGSCAAGQASVEILSREKAPLEANLEHTFMKRLSDLCINETDIESVDHTASCEDFDDDCESRPVPSQDDFDVSRFLGKWYSFARLKSSTQWESGALNLTLKDDGNIEALYVSSRQGNCVQTVPITLERAEGGKASEWTFKSYRTVSAKVVYTDYNNIAVIHECDAAREDGSCMKGHRHVEVLSRDPVSPEEGTSEKLIPIGLQLCIRKSDLRRTPKPVVCELTKKIERQCTIDQLPHQEDLNAYLLLGEWFSYARLKGTSALNSAKYLITRNDAYGSKFKVFYSGSRIGQCVTNEQSIIESRTDEPNKFTIGQLDNSSTGELTILYADDKHVLAHECYNVQPDGTCNKDDTYVEIFTKDKKLYSEARIHILDALYKACFSVDDLVLSVQEVDCNIRIPHKQCGFDHIKGHPNMDYRSIMGKTWFTRARFVPGAKPLWTGLGHIEFTHVDTNNIQIAWGAIDYGKSSECFSGTANMKLQKSTGELLEQLGDNFFVTSKVLFADNDLLVIYDCKTTQERSNLAECPPDSIEIGVHSRERVQPLSETAIRFIKDIVRTQTCVDPELLELLNIPGITGINFFQTVNDKFDGETTGFYHKYSEPCPSPAREKLGRTCYQDTIIAQENLELIKISGLWFQVARAHSAVDIHWDAGVFHLSVENPNTVRIQFTGRSRFNNDTCLPVYTVDAYPDSRQPGYMVFSSERFHSQNGLMKIIHADDDVLIIYECLPGGQQDNGLCKRNKEHIEIYARRNHINSNNFQKVERIIQEKTCFSADDLIMANRTIHCALPGHREIEYLKKSCKVGDYAAANEIDYKLFSGLWYEIERTQYQDEAVEWSRTAGHLGKMWEAANIHYDALRDDVFNYSYTGYTPSDGLCQGPFVAHTHPAPGESAHSGYTRIYPGHTQAHGGPWHVHGDHKILWTDYEIAIVYICFGHSDDGACRRSSEFVSIISRKTKIDDAKLQILHNMIKEKLCIDVHDFVQPNQDYERCLETHGIHTIDEETSGDGEKQEQCPLFKCANQCPAGRVTDESGCQTCQCIEHDDDNGSGSGSIDILDLHVQIKTDYGSGDNEIIRSEGDSSGAAQLTNEETEIISELDKLSAQIGH